VFAHVSDAKHILVALSLPVASLTTQSFYGVFYKFRATISLYEPNNEIHFLRHSAPIQIKKPIGQSFCRVSVGVLELKAHKTRDGLLEQN
jgi:hypothetical protein